MNTKTISYTELSKNYVKEAILFNQLPTADEDWAYGFIISPMLDDKMMKDTEEQAKDQGVNVEDLDEPASILDYAEGIYQTFIIDDMSALRLYNNTSEIISYSEKLDSFFWHVCHYGTSWSGVHAEVRADNESTDDDVWDVQRLASLTHG